MKTNHVYIVLIVVLTLCIPITKTEAYFTTAQSAIPLEGGALFTLTYAFGHDNHEITMPFFATSTGEKTQRALSYAITDSDGTPVPGSSSAIILSNASLGKDNMYTVQKGILRTFTLVIAFTPSVNDPKDYTLQVTHLPFTFDGSQNLQLNPSELQYYVTPEIDT